MCSEAVWINAGQVRVECSLANSDHQQHVGFYSRPGRMVRQGISWSGPVGATVITPAEIAPWDHVAETPPRKPWEASR